MGDFILLMARLVPCTAMLFAYHRFANSIARPIFKNKVIYYLELLILIIIQCVVTSYEKPAFTIISLLTLTLVTIMLLYEGKRKALVFYTILFCIYLIFADAFSTLLLSVCLNGSMKNILKSTELFFDTGIFTAIFITCTFKVFIWIIKRPKLEEVALRQLGLMIILGAFELISICGIINFTTAESSGGIILWIFTGFLAIDIYTIYIFDKISENQKLKTYFSLLEQQKEIAQRYYKDLESKYNDSRKYIHDFKKHLQVIGELGEIPNTYYETLSQDINRLGYKFHCENSILNIIINDKILLCESKGISFETSIQYTDISIIDDFDLTVIFVNLIENAIEECDRIDGEKFIKLNIGQQKNYVVIQVSNPCNPLGNFVYRQGYTTKHGHMGIGLSNVKDSVEKYGGNIHYQDCDGVFKVNIIVPTI